MSSPATILDVLDALAQRAPDAPTLRGVGGFARSRRELISAVDAVAATLQGAGVGRGDIVMIALPDGPKAFISLLGAMRVATALPAPPLEAATVYERMFDDLGVRAVIMSDRPDAALTKLAAERGVPLLRLRDDPGVNFAIDRAGAPRPAQAPTGSDDAVIVATAGSTGTPKFVASTHESLLRSVQRFAEWNEFGERDHSLCVMPIAHLHSLIRSALPVLVVGGALTWAPGFRARDALDWIDKLKPTIMTGAPTVFRALLDEADARGWKPGASVLGFTGIGSDKVEPELVERMRVSLSCHVAQFYGLSETAPFIAMTPRRQSMPRNAAGKLNPDWDVAILAGDGQPAAPGVSGEIAVRGGHVNRLIGKSAPTRERFDAEGRFLTGDLARIDADGFLYVEGRADDRITRGGEKISPVAVEAALQLHPAVARAVVFGVGDKLLGQRVAALVELKPGATVDEAALRAHAAESVESFAAPERIVIVDAIPLTRVGKISRREIATQHAELFEKAKPVKASAPGADSEVLAILRRHLRNDALGPDDDFFEHGGDSLTALEMLLEIEQRFGVSLSPAVLVQHGAASALERYLASAKPSKTTVQVVEIARATPRTSLVLAHGLGGGVTYAAPVAAEAADDVQILALHEHTIEGDLAQRDLYHMARRAADALAPSLADDVIACGHSLGAHIALALAHVLAERGRPLRFVGVLDDSADLDHRNFNVEQAPPKERAVALANLWAHQRTTSKPFPGRVVLFGATAETAMRRSDPTAGWGEIALGGVDLVAVEGTHSSILRTPDVVNLGAAIGKSVRQPKPEREVLPFDEGRRLRYEARVASRRGDLNAEIAYYREAIALDPHQPYWVFGNLSEALRLAKDIEGALAAYHQAVAHDPWPLTTDIRFISWLSGIRRTDEIDAALARAAALRADHGGDYERVGALHLALRRFEDAEVALTRAVESEPRLIDARLKLADVVKRRGDTEAAAAHVDTAQQNEPTVPWLCAFAVRHHIDAGHPQRALAVVQRYTAHSPADYEIDLARGDAYFMQELWSEAAEGYRLAVGHRRNGALALYGLARSLIKTGRAAEAREYVQRAIDTGVSTPEMLALAADLGIAKG